MLFGLLSFSLLFLALGAAPAGAQDATDPVARGRYLTTAAACGSCHTLPTRPDMHMAGGRAMATPYGTFNMPNITPDPETGIGGWSDEDFIAAMKEGVAPDGSHYYPIFPYRWYRAMAREDLLAIKAYLDSLPPIENAVREHDLMFPYSIRPLTLFWKFLNLGDDIGAEVPAATPQEQRGAYVVNVLGHCSACHTPTDMLGNFDESLYMAGNPQVPGAYTAANVTPHQTSGIGGWSDEDLMRVLKLGIRPDGTPVRGSMAEYVTDSSSRLTDEDLRAAIAYLRRILPHDNTVARTPEARTADVFSEELLAYSADPQADPGLGRAIALGASGPAADACYRCHGAGETGASAGIMPLLDGQSAPYLAKQLDDYASGARQSPVMGEIAQRLGRHERLSVAAFYARLPPPFAEETPPPEPEIGGAAIEERGRMLALRGDRQIGVMACIACHDRGGTGFPPSFPYLVGQHAGYTEAQFALWRRGLRANDPLGVMRDIADRLSAEDVRAVARYYEALASE